ncbi:hypothetical protein P168DRAFT_287650 [Aspergillus campestris IBT 28561]|uniref:Mis18 domain-containing protein n=1 Tax=Aspergillus campestris (strain IBT 28561) TaxID=1392248 RepID=A0A2I1DBA9_ASPC2|nr:uncharacterized protein P168DRAFT_287650 [Aspergillus campestris IBT 28561]PKY07153.1 hypothetical protein P168DRAFT_287650 [Aspergillus campestris IBT 28561]
MDLSRLTRPAILCQCSRCSSSLAALENEWAKLSNSYSVAAGWLSVELHRISISSEKKQIPQSSDLSILRGRILQDVSCKLCQQRLGVLSELDNGPNILWKMSKVSFREIVTMRTVEPMFKDGALEQLLHPTPKDSGAKRDRQSSQAGALIPTGSAELDYYNSLSVEQQIQHQGLSLDHISSSVINLHDTMSELKGAFTALRIELNTPGRSPELGMLPGNDFSMIATVLKELRNKSDENDKLKLENEALKLKNRYMEEQATRHLVPVPSVEEMLPEVRSPGLLQAGRKRGWPEAFSSGHTQPIADSFDDNDDDDEDSMTGFSLATPQAPPMRVPPQASTAAQEPQQPQETTEFRIEVGRTTHADNRHHESNHIASSPQQAQPVAKRPRLSQPADRPPSNTNPERKVGRPRKSLNPTPKDTPETSKPAASTETSGPGSQGERVPLNTSPDQRNTRPGQLSSTRLGAKNSFEQDMAQTPGSSDQDRDGNATQPPSESSKENPSGTKRSSAPDNVQHKDGTHERRKSQMAQRDLMVRLAMQREEAMETGEAR